nr:MAG TPA: hypothetical protein [Bacteriophage sp.]
MIYTSLNKKKPTFSRNSIAYLNGVSYPANTPRFTDGGLLIERGTTNLLSAADNQSFSSAATVTVVSGNTYTISCKTGTITLSGAAAGTVTNGNPVTITASSTSLVLTPADTVTFSQVENLSYATSWQIGGAARSSESLLNINQAMFPDQNNWKIEFDYNQKNFASDIFFKFDTYSHLWMNVNNFQLIIGHVSSGRGGLTMYPSSGMGFGIKHRFTLIKKGEKTYDVWFDNEKVLSDFEDTDTALTTDRIYFPATSVSVVGQVRVSTGTWTDDKIAADAQLSTLPVESDTTYYMPLTEDLRYLTYLF